LIKLSGKKYHRKKNQYNQFIKKYDYRIEEIQSPEVIKNCIDLSLKWYDYKSLQSEQLKNEQKAIFDIFSNIKIFNNIKGIAVYVNNEIAGFAIGEKLNSKMATVHFEKGNYNFSGIYPFLNKSLVEIFFRDVEFINLQEDLGLEGLRRAKSAYQPIKLEKKYLVNKRRTKLTLREAYEFAATGIKPKYQSYMNKQVLNEIEYILSVYDLEPKL